MKFQKLALAVLGVVALTAATLTLTLNSNAQGDPSRGGRDSGFQGAGPQGFQGGPPPQGFPGGQPGQPGQFRPGMGFGGGMGGGGAAMDSDNNFLYVLQGNMLFKVSKADLKVVGASPLGPQGMQGQGLTRRPPRDGQATPPPPPAK